jgi:hypothetical protein
MRKVRVKMKIIIDVPDEMYEVIKNSTKPLYYVEHLIKNGTPLKAQEPTIKDDLTDDHMKVRRYFDAVEYKRKTKTAATVTALAVFVSIMLLIALII